MIAGEDGERATSGLSDRLVTVLFGDRLGLTIFLGALVCFGVWWRIGFFITDSTTIANTLANVADGRLAVVETPYSLTLGSQPGLHRVGDQLFGRNYGHVLVSLPVLWALDVLGAVADVRLVLAGVWSLLLVALAEQIGVLTDRRRIATVGSGLALLCFVGNTVTATSLSEGTFAWEASSSALAGAPTELLALQMTTMAAAAIIAVTMYRLVAHVHSRRVGAVAGAGIVLATPVSFWASIPKRHALTAAVAMVALYCFAVSREGASGRHRWARAGSYGALGLLTTVHPFEALFLFLVLVPLDLLTAPSNGYRTLGLISAVFFVTLIPFFVVNTLISGNPLQPPRMLSQVGTSPDLTPSAEPDVPGSSGGGNSSGGNNGGGATGGDSSGGGGSGGKETNRDSSGGGGSGGKESNGDSSGGGGLLPLGVVVGPLLRATGYVDRIVEFVVTSLTWGLGQLNHVDQLYHTFLRSGRIPSLSYATNTFEVIELTLLESFPLAAGLVWLPVAWLIGLRASIDDSRWGDPARQTDLLAAAFAVIFTVVYLPRLPLFSQITLRYILPIMPLLLYGLVRLSVVRRPIESAPRWLCGTYLATVAGGFVIAVATVATLDLAVGEAVQFHALVSLATAAVAGLSVLTWRGHGDARIVAVGLALPAGMTTVFLTLSSLVYFEYGTHALGLTREIAGLLPVV